MLRYAGPESKLSRLPPSWERLFSRLNSWYAPGNRVAKSTGIHKLGEPKFQVQLIKQELRGCPCLLFTGKMKSIIHAYSPPFPLPSNWRGGIWRYEPKAKQRDRVYLRVVDIYQVASVYLLREPQRHPPAPS